MKNVVISHPQKSIAEGGFQIEGQLDPQELRGWILYHDKLDWPENNLIYVPHTPEFQFLIDHGVAQRTKTQVFRGLFSDEMLGSLHMDTYRSLNEAEPGTWSLATGEKSFNLPTGLEDNGRGLLLKLLRAVPIPNDDVPFEEILRFKDKRASELIAFQHRIDELYEEINASPDRPLSERKALEAIDIAAKNQIEVAKEMPFKFSLSDFSLKFNARDAALAALAASECSLSVTNIALAGIAGGAAANVEFTSGINGGDGNKSHPFEYIRLIHRDLVF